MKGIISKRIHNKRGVTAFETILGFMCGIFLMILFFGLFSYSYPRQMLEKHTSMLAQHAKVNGGLTAANIQDFNAQMNEYGYRATVNAYTESGSALNVAPKGTKYDVCMGGGYVNFVNRESAQKITIEVVVKANNALLKGPLAWFGAAQLPDDYTVTEVVLSERNRC